MTPLLHLLLSVCISHILPTSLSYWLSLLLPLANFHFSVSLRHPPTSSQHISLSLSSPHLSPPPTMFSFNLSLQKCVQLQSSQITSDDLVLLLLLLRLILPCALSQLLISMLETSIVSMSGPLHQKRPLKAQQSQSYGSFFFVCVPVSSGRDTLHLACDAHWVSCHQLLLRITRIGFL